MEYLLYFAIEIILIFILSKKVQSALSQILFRVFKNEKIVVYVVSFLFLPGTFVHEISHFITALFLLVPVGEMQLIPKVEPGYVRLGGVLIGKTDPIRKFFIGSAPLFYGVVIICLIFYFYPIGVLVKNIWALIAVCYIVFTISNSMFSSKRDMEGVWGFVFIVLFVSIFIWLLGVRVDLTIFIARYSEIFRSASYLLLFPIILDFTFLALIPKNLREVKSLA